MNIRKADHADIPAIKRIAALAWHDTYLSIRSASTIAEFLEASYSEERLERRMKESVFIVAEAEGEVVGFASFISGKELYLSAIYVMPKYQRHHIGSKLLAAGLEIYAQYDAIYVECATDNNQALTFYRNHGFELIREYPEELFGEAVVTGLFKKTLE